MTMRALTNVILRREGSSKDDQGDLAIGQDSIQFAGHKEHLSIPNIQFVSIGKPPGLTFGDWVKVEYGEGSQPSAIYLKEKQGAGGVNQIYAALQKFPHSHQFECRIWTQPARRFRLTHASAPRKHWGFTIPKKGVIASTSMQTLTVSARGLNKREITLAEVAGYTRELLTVKRQLLGVGLDTLIFGAGFSGLVSVVYALSGSGAGEASLMGFLNLFVLFLAIGVVLCLLYALPTLLRLRTMELFTLKLRNEKQWDFGVPEQQAQNVVEILESLGIKRELS